MGFAPPTYKMRTPISLTLGDGEQDRWTASTFAGNDALLWLKRTGRRCLHHESKHDQLDSELWLRSVVPFNFKGVSAARCRRVRGRSGDGGEQPHGNTIVTVPSRTILDVTTHALSLTARCVLMNAHWY